MKILAVETATPLGSVALVCHPEGRRPEGSLKVLGEITLYSEKSHSERLLPLIDLLLSQSGVDISEIDYFAASIGPGSFTGLRVGISTVKAFTFAHQKKGVGVPTLEAMSLSGIFHGGPICPFLDAGRGELYAALYSVTEKGDTTCLLPASIQKPAALILKLKEFQHQNRSETMLMVGDISLIEKEITDEKPFKGVPLLFSQPRASQVAHIAFHKIIAGQTLDSAELLPLYIRLPQAEANFKLN